MSGVVRSFPFCTGEDMTAYEVLATLLTEPCLRAAETQPVLFGSVPDFITGYLFRFPNYMCFSVQFGPAHNARVYTRDEAIAVWGEVPDLLADTEQYRQGKGLGRVYRSSEEPILVETAAWYGASVRISWFDVAMRKPGSFLGGGGCLYQGYQTIAQACTTARLVAKQLRREPRRVVLRAWFHIDNELVVASEDGTIIAFPTEADWPELFERITGRNCEAIYVDATVHDSGLLEIHSEAHGVGWSAPWPVGK
jgi:hypothetical protein